MDRLNIGNHPYVLVLLSEDDAEAQISPILKENTKSFKIKNRNYSENGIDYAIEFTAKDVSPLIENLRRAEQVKRFSIVQYDADNIF